jgi:hypothetical protein
MVRTGDPNAQVFVAAGDRRSVFRLEVGAEKTQMATVRLFIATTARVLGLDEELIADLKLAASEAATAGVAAPGSGLVIVRVGASPDEIMVSISPVTAEILDGEPPRPADVISALFPAATLDGADRALRIPIERGPSR